jgi:flagellin
MAISVNTNVASLNTQRNLLKTGTAQQTALQRLSSGLRINSAKDDAAGLAISDRMNSQVRGLNQAIRNANDGISLAQTAEGALQESTSLLQRMRELAIQSANDTNSPFDRASLQDEVFQIQSEINRIAESTQFNGRQLLDGTFGVAKFHVGAEANQVINIATGDARSSALGAFQSYVEGTAEIGNLTHYHSKNITINGSKGSSVIKASPTDNAKTLAVQINYANGETGVISRARTEFVLTDIAPGYEYKLEVTAGQYTGTVAASVLDDGSLQDLVDSINDQTNRTGVTAFLNNEGNQILLVDPDGDNIQLRRTDPSETEWTINTAHADEETGTIKLTHQPKEREMVFEESRDDKGKLIRDEQGELVTEQMEVPTSEEGTSLPVFYGDRLTDVSGKVEFFESNGKPQYWAVDEENRFVYEVPANSGVYMAEGAEYLDKEGTVFEYIPGKNDQKLVVGEGRVELNNCTIRGYVLLESNKNFSANEEGIGNNVINKYDQKTQSASLSPINDVDITTQEKANHAISVIDKAIATVDQIRSGLGAYQNRFVATISNLSNVAENISASKSRILDADFAMETSELTKAQILQEAGLSMLAQANQLPQAALKLLG